jgi:secreted PhoX family phosphatase
MLSRRDVLQRGAAFSLGFAGLHALMRPGMAIGDSLRLSADTGYGPLVADPNRIISLPPGFKYTVISSHRQRMDDGLYVPAKHDGMAAFAGPEGRTIIVRNHELDTQDLSKGAFGGRGQHLTNVLRPKLYDSGTGAVPALGGTTTLVFNTKTQELERHFMSLAGTVYNCAGGPTPWGTWLSCEETMSRAGQRYSKDHGFVFEVVPTAEPELQVAKPIEPMGRFTHEAVAIDPKSGVVYMTEDVQDGLLYRYIPKVPGKLHEGGRLQCLMLKDITKADLRHWDRQVAQPGRKMPVAWIDFEDIYAPNNDGRYAGQDRGAAIFARGEGMWYAGGTIYFACTVGGKQMCGQIWKYTPSAAEGTPGESTNPGMLELFVEPDDSSIISNCDNITVAPWGDLIVCEDAVPKDDKVNFLLGITPEGKVYKLAENISSASEFAGATFSPDGTTLFVNVQENGVTLAITGPWDKRG